MSKYHRKQRTPESDEFISFWAKFFEWVQPYVTAIGIASMTALVILFAVWGTTSWLEGKAQNAAEIFGRAVKTYEAELVTDPSPPKTDDENPVPRFKTAKERSAETLRQLDELDRSYGSTEVARGAVLFRAGVLYDGQQYEEAGRLYDKFAKSGPHDPMVMAIAKEGVALCDEQRGKLDDALAKYEALASGLKGDFFKDRALLDLARIHVKKGDKKGAAALYKRILAEVPVTPLKDEVQTQLADAEGS